MPRVDPDNGRQQQQEQQQEIGLEERRQAFIDANRPGGGGKPRTLSTSSSTAAAATTATPATTASTTTIPATAATVQGNSNKHQKPAFRLGDRFFLLNWVYLWVFPLIRRCRTESHIHDIALELARKLTAQENGEELYQKWAREKATANLQCRPPQLIKALYKLYGRKYITIGLWKLLWAAFTWTGAYYFLQQSLTFLENLNNPILTGHLYALGLLLTSLGSTVAIHQLYGQCSALGIQVKGSISVLVYRKALVLARIRGGAGEIINILSTDVARIVDAVTNFHFLWSAMVETLLILILAFPTVGWQSALMAVALVLMVLPVQIYLGRLTSEIQIHQTVITTERVHLMSEILTAIKLIKFYAWEQPFSEQVHDVRTREMALFKKNMQVKAINFTVVFVLPVTVALCALAVYNAVRTGPLSSSVVFTALSIFNTLRYPFLMLPIAVKSTSGARLALARLDDFLTQAEVEPLPDYSASEGGDKAIEIVHGTFSWDGDKDDDKATIRSSSKASTLNNNNIHTNNNNSPTTPTTTSPALPPLAPQHRQLQQLSETNLELEPVTTLDALESDNTLKKPHHSTLYDINLSIFKHQVVAIIGDVGSGKSSLIAALLGQIRQLGTGPRLKLYGTSSYVPQEAWLINVNLRENIVFGKEFDSERYWKTIKVCALERDLSLLSHGDMTEIGERGSNLSGGQKQRVSLARAVYQQSDIVLMDDPMSALDQTVGEHIFDQCIRGFLNDRTVVIVTHQLQYLHRCDTVVMMQGGKIAYQGSYDELMVKEKSFRDLITAHVVSDQDQGLGQGYDEDSDSPKQQQHPAVASAASMAFHSNGDGGNSRGGQYHGHNFELEKNPLLSQFGAGQRRKTLPVDAVLGDEPGTTTLSRGGGHQGSTGTSMDPNSNNTLHGSNIDQITKQEKLQLLKTQAHFLRRNSYLAQALGDDEFDDFNIIRHMDGNFRLSHYHQYGDFGHVVHDNELTVHSIPDNYDCRSDSRHGGSSIPDGGSIVSGLNSPMPVGTPQQQQQHPLDHSPAEYFLKRHSLPVNRKKTFQFGSAPGHSEGVMEPSFSVDGQNGEEGGQELGGTTNRHQNDNNNDQGNNKEFPAEEMPVDHSGGAKLIGEDQSMNEFGFADYVKYFRSGSGVIITICLIVLFFFAHGIRIGSDYWLRLWVPNSLNTTDGVYLGVYAIFILCFGTAVLTRGLWFAHEATLKAIQLHDQAFQSVMLAPMSFFETTSLGQILSAFSKSMFTVDDTLPDAALQFLQYFPLALGAFLMIAIVVHWQNAVAVICLLFLAIVVVWYGFPADAKLKKLEAITKPKIFQHITTTLEGLFSIRAYHVQDRFDQMNISVLDKNHENLFAMQITKTWMAFYLDVISSFMVYTTAVFLVIYRDQIYQVSSVAGLALSNALQMLVFLQWTVRQMGDVQAMISSVGQLDYYGRQIAAEAPAESGPGKKPDASWPQQGRIDFQDLVLKYRHDSPPVLKNVTFTIQPNEKVGIVGRTGSGKSTLLVGLLRIVEAHSGKILIDGLDISQIGLKDLRTKIGIIPQEPVLFVGSLRKNLDPFGEHQDLQIWKALDAVHLGDKVKAMPEKLDSPVIENGKNFSLGQRQLICIARSLVIGSKIIVLDEASASISMAMDKLLQETIKVNFADCTVLTIAHRLNTIIESDKVLVMDGGVVVEFGEPHKLLQDPNGIFAELVSHAGQAASKKLALIAEDAHKDRNNGVDVVKEEIRNEKKIANATAVATSRVLSGLPPPPRGTKKQRLPSSSSPSSSSSQKKQQQQQQQHVKSTLDDDRSHPFDMKSTSPTVDHVPVNLPMAIHGYQFPPPPTHRPSTESTRSTQSPPQLPPLPSDSSQLDPATITITSNISSSSPIVDQNLHLFTPQVWEQQEITPPTVIPSRLSPITSPHLSTPLQISQVQIDQEYEEPYTTFHRHHSSPTTQVPTENQYYSAPHSPPLFPPPIISHFETDSNIVNHDEQQGSLGSGSGTTSSLPSFSSSLSVVEPMDTTTIAAASSPLPPLSELFDISSNSPGPTDQHELLLAQQQHLQHTLEDPEQQKLRIVESFAPMIPSSLSAPPLTAQDMVVSPTITPILHPVDEQQVGKQDQLKPVNQAEEKLMDLFVDHAKR